MKNQQPIYICDFNDSFTYNIFSILKEKWSDLSIEIIPKNRVLSFLQTTKNESRKVGIIIGPGPGHPADYQFLYPSLSHLLDKKNIFLMGICLGHQIIWNLKGHNVSHSPLPVHGHVESYSLSQSLSEYISSESVVHLQRYNSLSVFISEENIGELEENSIGLNIKNNELNIFASERLFTVQAHPESIGTTCPDQFFRPIVQFLL